MPGRERLPLQAPLAHLAVNVAQRGYDPIGHVPHCALPGTSVHEAVHVARVGAHAWVHQRDPARAARDGLEQVARHLLPLARGPQRQLHVNSQLDEAVARDGDSEVDQVDEHAEQDHLLRRPDCLVGRELNADARAELLEQRERVCAALLRVRIDGKVVQVYEVRLDSRVAQPAVHLCRHPLKEGGRRGRAHRDAVKLKHLPPVVKREVLPRLLCRAHVVEAAPYVRLCDPAILPRAPEEAPELVHAEMPLLDEAVQWFCVRDQPRLARLQP